VINYWTLDVQVPLPKVDVTLPDSVDQFHCV